MPSCPHCQRENRIDAQFCDGCGARLSLACGVCSRELRPGARFCDGCGARVGGTAPGPARREPRDYTPRHLAAKILHQQTALEGERKHVTVLFADLADSTPLAEGLDPEEMHVLMDRSFGLILEQVHRYEGTVNQFLGDGILALFGAPIALEDAPRRAVLAALGIQEALRGLDEEVSAAHGTPFRWRVGIHTGPVVVGRIGDDLRMDYTAIGDTMNLAARLQSSARPGSIRISADVQSQIAGFFETRDLGTLDLKGKSEPVRAFEVLEEREVSGRIEAAASAAGLTPYVGRDRERDVLQDAFAATRAGRGRLVQIVGEAGLGKSRLLYEFRRSLEGEPHIWLEGRCSPFGRTTAFESVRDALRRSVGIDENDDEASAAAKLEDFERGQGGGLAWTLPYLRHLLSLPVEDTEVEGLEAASRRSQIFRALQAIILRAAERMPVVVVMEDLHWVDPASQEFLAFFAHSVPSSRVLMLVTYRPGTEHAFGDRSYHLRLDLDTLSDTEMDRMTGSLLGTGSIPRALRRMIREKTDGNPFFVEEVTQCLVEEGLLERRGDAIRLVGELSAASVPDRIQDVLMARIDRLEEEPKRAIQVASVIGREFALRLLERISDVGDQVRDVVEDLRALELIYEKAAHPELAFMFKHALTHEVAYESVLVQRRKGLHRIVGGAIEELYAGRLEEHYEALAHHFERGEQWEKALEYHGAAAAKAAAAYANVSAADHTRSALEIAERLGDEVPDAKRMELELQLARASSGISDFRASGDAFVRAAELTPDPADRARSLCWAAYNYHWGHHYGEDRETLDRALGVAREHRVRSAHAFCLALEGYMTVTQRGENRGFEARLERGLERIEEPDLRTMALQWHSMALDWGGSYRQALSAAESAVGLARKGGLGGHALIASLWCTGKAASCLGLYDRALHYLTESRDLAERSGDRAWLTRILNTLGWCHAEFGSYDMSREYNRESTEMATEMVELGLVAGAPELFANAAINLASCLLPVGETNEAAEHLDRLRLELERNDDPWQRWRYSQHLENIQARLAIARGDPEAALPRLERELAAAREHGSRKIEARALELRGRALVTLDRREDAEAALAEALRLATAIEHPPVAWRARSLLGELARRAGDGALADEHRAETRALVERHAASLPDAGLARGLRALGGRLADEPLAAYR